MIFTSLTYFAFLIFAVGLTFSLPERWRVSFLLAASYLFYMYWKASYIWIVIGLTAVDFALGPWIERSRDKTRTTLWILSIVANLGILVIFKYLGFLAREWNELAAWIGHGGPIAVPDLLLPIGISFHTFQAISYTTDVYRGRIQAERNPVHFALFIAWFPQMIAGPIERAQTLLVQLKRISLPSSEQIRNGLFLVAWGLFKKLVVADNLGVFVDMVFASPGDHGRLSALVGIYGYAFQIYCDFSGYTDIARGSSLFFGVNLSENFNRPYLSASLIEFWKRWHISLSNWFFEYVFFPLARRFPTDRGLIFAVMAVFVLSGLWHGANLTYVYWGFLNGVIYIGYLFWRRLGFAGPRSLAVLINFNLVCLCWVFFRAQSLSRAEEVFGAVLRPAPDATTLMALLNSNADAAIGATVGLAVLALHALAWERWIPRLRSSWRNMAVYLPALVVTMVAFGRWVVQGFIYFQF